MFLLFQKTSFLRLELWFYLLVFVVQFLSRIWLFVIPQTAACQVSLSFTISLSLLKLMSIDMTIDLTCPNSWPLSQWCHTSHPLLPLLLLPSIFPSFRAFSSESALCLRWPKYWSFSFSISPFSEYSGLISFGIDWFDLNYLDLINHPVKQLLSQTQRSRPEFF